MSFPSLIENNQIVREISHSFQNRGFQLWLVGGYVRDYTLGQVGNDIDFATDASPDEIWSILNGYKLEGYICSAFDIGKVFGTCGITLSPRMTTGFKDIIAEKTTVEITTFRSESYVRGSRKPTVELGGTILTDLARRDYSFNAIAVNCHTGEVVDPYDGATDLKNGIVRAVGDPAERFIEDPLRMLRAARFAARFGYTIDGATWFEMRDFAAKLRFISRERIADELNKIMRTEKPSVGFRYLYETGLLTTIHPAFCAFNDVRGNGDKRDGLFPHTMKVIDNCQNEVTRWAALFHDIGKPDARREKGGVLTFHNHEAIGADIARQVLSELRFPNNVIDDVSRLVKMHMRINLYRPEHGDTSIRRFIVELGDLLPNALELARYDKVDYKIGRPNDISDYIAGRVEELTKDPIRPPIDGVEIMSRFNLRPGPIIGQIKDTLLEQVINGELSSSDKGSAFLIAEKILEESNA